MAELPVRKLGPKAERFWPHKDPKKPNDYEPGRSRTYTTNIHFSWWQLFTASLVL